MATLSEMKSLGADEQNQAFDKDAKNPENSTDSLTVTQALQLAKGSLESIRVKVMGEVSEFRKKQGWAAVYFALKDENSVMSCQMWIRDFQQNGIELNDGALIEAKGYFSVYPKKGTMSFSVTSFALAGEGVLRLKVAKLAQKLKSQGYMDPQRKKPVPDLIEKVAIVTSPRGKAIHDVIRTLRRRSPHIEVYVVGIPVEGKNAHLSICEGLKVADTSDCDVILLVRGGGSYEDLMPFNDEEVAMAVAGCKKPVVTGIGHEPDNSIADMIADRRCSTPTAAAEAVTEDLEEIKRRIDISGKRMANALLSKVKLERAHIKNLAAHSLFKSPVALLQSYAMRLDLDAMNLENAIPNAIESNAAKVKIASDLLVRIGHKLLEQPRSSLRVFAAHLNDLSPLSVLARGYSITYGTSGRVVKNVTDVCIDETLRIKLSDGCVDCKVVDVKKEEGNTNE